MKYVFMGTPDFAAIILRRLAIWTGARNDAVAAVYCRQDKPAGRGHRLSPPPVKLAALELGLPVRQPAGFRDESAIRSLAGLGPDMLIVAAYGLLLPQSVLDIPALGAINVHASLLPCYRGAAPIQRAIIRGELSTGITSMSMDAGLDTGPMLRQTALAIGPDDTAGSLHAELADLGARLLLETLALYADGSPPVPVPQNPALASYAPRMEKQDGFIDWSRPAHEVHARIRGVTPWPGARATALLPGREALPLLIMPGAVGARTRGEEPGSLLDLQDGCLPVACADRLYHIPAVRPDGRASMSAAAFWNGYGPRGRGAPARLRRPDEPDGTGGTDAL
jgi:methionyl-tRNA formyltransferase